MLARGEAPNRISGANSASSKAAGFRVAATRRRMWSSIFSSRCTASSASRMVSTSSSVAAGSTVVTGLVRATRRMISCSSSCVGYSISSLNMNRSTCASGSE